MNALLFARLLAAFAAAWAVVALTWQAVRATRNPPRDFAEPAGSPARGVLYAFTGAMTPAHKESIRLYPLEFALGLILHVPVFITLAATLLTIANPAAGGALIAATRVAALVGFAAGVCLLIRRLRRADLRHISTPDDYAAIVATSGLLMAAGLLPMTAAGQAALLSCAALLFVYVPLGKLRHVVFFFLARAEYGRRLGYRGVYPPVRAE